MGWKGLVSSIVVGVALVGCGTGEIEGDEAEECRDGADNDQDGYFDCQDNGCWESPDCDGAPDDDDATADDDDATADDDDATGDDDDATVDDDDATGDDDDATGDDDDASDDHPNCGDGPTITEDITGFALTYSLAQDFNPKPAGVTDCVMEYAAADTALIERRGRCISFDGAWSQTASDCLADFDALVWVGSGEHVHSFVFNDDLTQLDDWVVTQSTLTYDPAAGDWAVFDMAAPYADGVPVVYVEVVPVPEAFVTVTHTVAVSFTTD